ncbi:S1C family serine protease, partial [Rhizobium johnstonii]
VVLTSDGYIVTNTHVVTLDGATADAAITVTTSDGKVFQAEIIGTDPTYDLAVIKLTDASGLTPIEFGDSSNLNVGDQTVAIGAPLGLSNT